MYEILDILEKEDRHADVYIETNDPGLLTDEDSADEDDSGLIDNLSGRQLAGHAEAIFPNGHRITDIIMKLIVLHIPVIIRLPNGFVALLSEQLIAYFLRQIMQSTETLRQLNFLNYFLMRRCGIC